LRKSDGAAVGEVRDTGIGIAVEDLPNVFERFYRVDKARSRESGGAGLGLSIGRWIAKAHAGTIEVQSSPGSGSVFQVRLPLSNGDS
jgi:two-component system sensor histidine kinase BaeS